MNREQLKEQINNTIHSAIESKDYFGTWYIDLGIYGDNRYAIAIAWMDYDNDTKYDLYMKIANQPKNSIMQCDYDIDWKMPIINGGIFDSEIYAVESDVDWMLDQWETLKRYLEKFEK